MLLNNYPYDIEVQYHSLVIVDQIPLCCTLQMTFQIIKGLNGQALHDYLVCIVFHSNELRDSNAPITHQDGSIDIEINL